MHFNGFLLTLHIMKYRLDWQKFLVFLFVAGGLVLITGSFLMSLGIFLLLLVIDYYLAQYEHKKQFEKEMKERLEEKEKEK